MARLELRSFIAAPTCGGKNSPIAAWNTLLRLAAQAAPQRVG